MCGICGCSEHKDNSLHHSHHTKPLMSHHHDDLVSIEQDILGKNNQFAKQNQEFFLKQKILAINIMSSPGSGKTTLLAKTINDLHDKINLAVVVGDQQTDYDASLLKASGAQAIQINTGKVCHLDAHMVGHAIEKLSNPSHMILFIENVGNLVCPALFHLGESYKIVVLSVTEGDNKPLKYPDMFHCADLMIITKMDLHPYVNFDLDQCINYAHQINPHLEVLTLSTTKEKDLSLWYNWLLQKQQCI